MNTIRRAIRSLRRSPGLVGIGVCILSLGVGLTTTAAAIMDAIIHPVLPYDAPDDLYRITQYGDGASHSVRGYEKYLALTRLAGTLEEVAALSPGPEGAAAGAEGEEFVYVTANFFDVVGVRPRSGRIFDQDEEHSALISEDLWRRMFQHRDNLQDARITIGDRTFGVIGVMPRGLSVAGWKPKVWLLLKPHLLEWPYMLEPIARVRQERLAAVRADLDLVAQRLTEDFGTGSRAFRFELRSAKPDPLGLRQLHLAIAGGAVAVLLIGCANVASLLLARGITREREISVMLALGATRFTIARQLLVECIVIGIAGTVVGTLIAVWGINVATARLPDEVPLLGALRPSLNPRVLLSSAGIAVLSVIGFGLIPALRASEASMTSVLSKGAIGSSRGARSFRVLVGGEVALSMVLVMSAALLLKAVNRVANYSFGFDAKKVWLFHVYAAHLPGPVSDNQISAFRSRIRLLTAGAAAIPGVERTSWMSEEAVIGGVVGGTGEQGEKRWINIPTYLIVGPGFLETLGLDITEGRSFAQSLGAERVAVVDERVATALWNSGTSQGRMIKLGHDGSAEPWIPVLGVVRTASLGFESDPDAGPERRIYVIDPSERSLHRTVLVRVTGNEPGLPPRILTALAGAAGGDRVVMRSFLSVHQDAVLARRVVAGVFATVAMFGLALSCVGLYGVLSYTVAQRRREMSIRLALGSSPRNISILILREGAAMALGGTAIGALVALWANRLLGHWLFTVEPTDVTALLVSEVVLIAVSLGAALPAAMGAARANIRDALSDQ